MLKISRRASAVISLVLTVMLLVIIVAGAVAMPWLADLMIGMPYNPNRADITPGERAFIITVAYLALASAAAADIAVFFLLRSVLAGQVFTDRVVALLRLISWCCFAFALMFVLIVYYFALAAVVAFCAVFVGICLRVVKNAFAEAVAIKNENDFTI